MVNLTILAGGYSTFVATYLFNSEANSLSLLSQSPTGDNPSWIDLHPTNKSILYATNENAVGGLQSFVIRGDGSLSQVQGNTGSGGDSPAFAVPLSTGEVAVMNYGSGDGLIIPTSEGGLQFAEDAPLISFPANVSHPHMAVEVGKEVFVPDLGADTIWRLASDGAPGKWSIRGQIDQPKGSGPRHIAVRGNQVYTLHELSSTLTQQTIPAHASSPGPARLAANFSILPPGLPKGAAMAAGEILLVEGSNATASPFRAPYIYVSNRNTGVQDPRGDAIAIYAVEPRLRFVKHVFTGIDQIRGMEFGGFENEFLVASGVKGEAGVLVLRRTHGGADLKIVAVNKEIPTRTSFVWLD
ncbi:putative isomerase YbhE [Trametes maxima]|nr:putative isomerase YbhE [Trametes maxima]